VFAQVAGIPRGVLTCLAADKKSSGWAGHRLKFIKAVELKSTKQGYELMCFGLEALAQDTVVEGAIWTRAGGGGISNISKRKKSKPRMWRPRYRPLRHRQKGNTFVDDGEELTIASSPKRASTSL